MVYDYIYNEPNSPTISTADVLSSLYMLMKVSAIAIFKKF